ncbi:MULTISPECIES: Fe-S cluster assembly scaffold protein NifU [unclassified Candidatus Frackibacter]|uniref:Fe-S cluster assembly scaffold protein NifU n=1 Tax=unclassified Candidatus Frackibacter TaxID=2648818 RepID=UPI0008827993|nr:MULTISPECIES: Fe-S cluster assembly scaffold protein NifU [unclassified Candidatus Frackibacter]SDC64878.1 nitrogen fixation protein NifU [Candidatus Frackibacter sp. WG11]SEM77158.1 nitrogen fixation protein NifU [Candidatus Frackibacter sp. WG12]SFL88939.1 nitrogen fixation protein NifU [Candidatus Frackibacter sp. WG13]
MYSDKVMDHFQNPRNVGEIEAADGIGEVGNPTCGDIMKIYIKVNENEEIKDIKFKTFGCGAAVATSSITTEIVKGKSIEEARELTNKRVAEALDGLPPEKMHCSNLAADALQKAIDNYLGIEENNVCDDCEDMPG